MVLLEIHNSENVFIVDEVMIPDLLVVWVPVMVSTVYVVIILKSRIKASLVIVRNLNRIVTINLAQVRNFLVEESTLMSW